MSMTFHCPSCGAETTLDVVISCEQTRLLMFDVLAKSLPLGAMVDRYLRLFKPAKQVLRADRVRKLLDTLVPDIRRNAIHRRGREWHVETATWKDGIEVVLKAHHDGKLDTPLADHAYLYEVLMRMVDKQEAQQERLTEATRLGREHAAIAHPVGQLMKVVDRAIDRARPDVAALAQPSAPAPRPPVGPSVYAQRIKAQQEAIRKQREEASKGDSTAEGSTP